jgi:hypothetical protein
VQIAFPIYSTSYATQRSVGSGRRRLCKKAKVVREASTTAEHCIFINAIVKETTNNYKKDEAADN